jgi:hypothetical protein
VGWSATLEAKDGSVINDVHRQLERLPGDATHLVISAGGNDVLFEIALLQEPVATVGDGLRRLADVRDRFDADYRRMLRAVLDRGLPTTLCTIYNPSSPDEDLQRETVTGLCLFNDGIVGAAREFKCPLIDLRAVCTDIADFANEIEPSSAGGAKIAQAICHVVLNHDYSRRQAVLFP